MKKYNDISLNTDEEVINYLKKSEKEGKVSDIIETENHILVDVEWAYNFEGHKVERRNFIYLLTRSNFNFNKTISRYVREKDEIRFRKIEKEFKRIFRLPAI